MIRLILQKLPRETNYDDGYQIFEHEAFDDQLVTDFNEQHSGLGVLTGEITETGFDLFQTAIQEAIESYPDEAVIEVLADGFIEHTQSETDCGTEYDAYGWFEEVRHRRLNHYQIEGLMEEWEDKPELPLLPDPVCACGPVVDDMLTRFQDMFSVSYISPNACRRCGHQIKKPESHEQTPAD